MENMEEQYFVKTIKMKCSFSFKNKSIVQHLFVPVDEILKHFCLRNMANVYLTTIDEILIHFCLRNMTNICLTTIVAFKAKRFHTGFRFFLRVSWHLHAHFSQI